MLKVEARRRRRPRRRSRSCGRSSKVEPAGATKEEVAISARAQLRREDAAGSRRRRSGTHPESGAVPWPEAATRLRPRLAAQHAQASPALSGHPLVHRRPEQRRHDAPRAQGGGGDAPGRDGGARRSTPSDEAARGAARRAGRGARSAERPPSRAAGRNTVRRFRPRPAPRCAAPRAPRRSRRRRARWGGCSACWACGPGALLGRRGVHRHAGLQGAVAPPPATSSRARAALGSQPVAGPRVGLARPPGPGHRTASRCAARRRPRPPGRAASAPGDAPFPRSRRAARGLSAGAAREPVEVARTRRRGPPRRAPPCRGCGRSAERAGRASARKPLACRYEAELVGKVLPSDEAVRALLERRQHAVKELLHNATDVAKIGDLAKRLPAPPPFPRTAPAAAAAPPRGCASATRASSTATRSTPRTCCSARRPRCPVPSPTPAAAPPPPPQRRLPSTPAAVRSRSAPPPSARASPRSPSGCSSCSRPGPPRSPSAAALPTPPPRRRRARRRRSRRAWRAAGGRPGRGRRRRAASDELVRSSSAPRRRATQGSWPTCRPRRAPSSRTAVTGGADAEAARPCAAGSAASEGAARHALDAGPPPDAAGVPAGPRRRGRGPSSVPMARPGSSTIGRSGSGTNLPARAALARAAAASPGAAAISPGAALVDGRRARTLLRPAPSASSSRAGLGGGRRREGVRRWGTSLRNSILKLVLFCLNY